MNGRRTGFRAVAGLLLGVLLLGAPRVAGAAVRMVPVGVAVALLPASQTVSPGAEFEVSLEVTRAGSGFNAFDCIVGYDPAVLTLLPQTPVAEQEGSYFKAACANRFHHFQPGAGQDTISDVLLCSATSLTGPGQVYRLRFKASTTAQLTTVRFLPGLQFYDAGLFVNPDSSSDATVGIGVPVDSLPARLHAPVLELSAVTDSVHANVTLRVKADDAGEQRLVVMNAAGQVVRRLQNGGYAAGRRRVVWDGRDDAGSLVPAGGYVAVIRVPGQVREARFTLAR